MNPDAEDTLALLVLLAAAVAKDLKSAGIDPAATQEFFEGIRAGIERAKTDNQK